MAKLAIVATSALTEQERLDEIFALGAAEGEGSRSWENVAFKIMEGVEAGTWSEANFVADKNGKIKNDIADVVLNGFYKVAVDKNKLLVRPAKGSGPYNSRCSNLRTIGRAAAKHDTKFRTQLQGTNGIIDGYLLKANKAKGTKSADPRKTWSAFEAIYRAAVRATDKSFVAGNAFSAEQIDECVFHPAKADKNAAAAFVDAVAGMINTLDRGVNGYDTKKDKVTVHTDPVFGDVELKDALKSLRVWHAKNAALGTPKKGKAKAVNLSTITAAQFEAIALAHGFTVSKPA